MSFLRLLSVTLLLAASVQAAMIALPAEELNARADVIATGSVTSVSSHWDDTQTRIYTDVTIATERFEKGVADRALVVRVPGGEVGDIGMWVEDMPVLTVGDRMTVRLVATEAGMYELVGAAQALVEAELDKKPALVYYSYSGYHRDPASCYYHINSGLPADWSSAIQAGGAAWNAAGSRFRFFYSGTADRTGPTYDGYNVVCRLNLGSGGILAQNTYWYVRKGKLVIENDIVFNTYYPWATNGSPSAYDVQGIGTHELGHCLVLDDLYKSYQSEMTMYGYGAPGETKTRTLEFGDKDGIIKIYGAGLASPVHTVPSEAAQD